jgi:hypothetical protein
MISLPPPESEGGYASQLPESPSDRTKEDELGSMSISDGFESEEDVVELAPSDRKPILAESRKGIRRVSSIQTHRSKWSTLDRLKALMRHGSNSEADFDHLSIPIERPTGKHPRKASTSISSQQSLGRQWPRLDQRIPLIRLHPPQQSPPQHPSGSQQSAPKAPAPAHLSSSTIGGSAGTKIPLQALPTAVAASRVKPPSPPVEEKYLLLCMHESEHLVVRDDVRVTNINYDQQMFQSIEAQYTCRRKKLRLTALKAWLGIKRPLGLSFVKASQARFILRTLVANHSQFDFVEETEVSNLQAPKLPPRRVTFYDFAPRDQPLPRYDNGAMMHRYNNPTHCGASTKIFEQIPKRKERKPIPGTAPDMYTGWGLYLIDGPDMGRLARVAIAVYVLSFLASFIFGLVWSLASPDTYKSVGDAWTTASYIFTAGAAPIGILALI